MRFLGSTTRNFLTRSFASSLTSSQTGSLNEYCPRCIWRKRRTQPSSASLAVSTKGGWPPRRMNKMMPHAHRSHSGPYPSVRSSLSMRVRASGLTYMGVPHTVCIPRSLRMRDDSPKSAIFTLVMSLGSRRRRFSSLRSRWAMPQWCRCAMPVSTVLRIDRASSSGRLPRSTSADNSSPPGTSSRIMYTLSASRKYSFRYVRAGWRPNC
mmetsp:Transcript_12914/g.33155  ORF Transcript_12914/g.33155 Transcript_12914/m.33155 type:complete len:209 (+) Transcript_12914:645-1271(+)